MEVVSRLRAVTSPVRLVCARARRDDAQRIYARVSSLIICSPGSVIR